MNPQLLPTGLHKNIFASSEKFCLIYNLWFPLLSYSSSVFLDQPTSVSRSVIISLWSRRTRFWLDAFFGAVVWVSRGSGLFHGVTIIHELKRGQSALQPNDVSCTIEEMILGPYLTLPRFVFAPNAPLSMIDDEQGCRDLSRVLFLRSPFSLPGLDLFNYCGELGVAVCWVGWCRSRAAT